MKCFYKGSGKLNFVNSTVSVIIYPAHVSSCTRLSLSLMSSSFPPFPPSCTDTASRSYCSCFNKTYYFLISVYISYLVLFKGSQSPSRGAADKKKDIIYIPRLTNGGEAGGLCVCVSFVGILWCRDEQHGSLWFDFACVCLRVSSGFHRGAAEAAPGCT